MLAVAFLVPLYSYVYLPPFDFLSYNLGTEIGTKNAIHVFDSNFNDVTEKAFAGSKPAYMIGLKEEMTQEESRKSAMLYQAYRNGSIHLFAVASRSGITIPDYEDVLVYFIDNVVLKSILRTTAGVVAFTTDRRIAGKWNLLYTPYRFDREYGEELCRERLKRWVFFGVLLMMIGGLFYGRKKVDG